MFSYYDYELPSLLNINPSNSHHGSKKGYASSKYMFRGSKYLADV